MSYYFLLNSPYRSANLTSSNTLRQHLEPLRPGVYKECYLRMHRTVAQMLGVQEKVITPAVSGKMQVERIEFALQEAGLES